MPEMHTIKVSDRDPAAIFRQRYAFVVTENGS
jgi:hypothetical protein